MLITPATALKPNSALAGPLDDLDLADGAELDRQRAPGREAVVIGVHLAAVDQHQHALRIRLIVAAHADLSLIVSPLLEIHPGGALQHARQIIGAGAADIVSGDDLHVGRHIRHPLRRPGGAGGDRFLEQPLERAVVDRLRDAPRAGRITASGTRIRR
jgi:hypothetical protein